MGTKPARRHEQPSEYIRPAHHALYSSRRWRAASERHRQLYPLCAECERQGRVRPASCVDHVVPHKGDVMLFWDGANWQSLCDECHAKKTAAGL